MTQSQGTSSIGQRIAPDGPKTSYRIAVGLGLLAFVALFAGLGGWMAVTEISGAVVAGGRIAVHGEAKTIKHLDGGIVAKIAVADGDVVKSGDELMRLDDTLLEANLKIYRTRLVEAIARRERLNAERDGLAEIRWPPRDELPLGVLPEQNIRESQQKLLHVRRTNREGHLAQLRQKIAQYQNQIDGVNGLKASKREQIGLINRELDGLKRLYENGNTTLNRLLTLERQKSALLGQQAEHDSQLARIANLISETNIKIVQVDQEFAETVLSDLRGTEKEVNELSQQYYATREQLGRVVIKAPVDGMIHQLKVHTEGGVVAQAEELMQIVPVDQVIEVVANIDPQFIDEVRIDQKARLRFPSFNQRQASEVDGVVRAVSPSVVVNSQSGGSYYVVRINVIADELKKIGGRERLVVGMPVEAFIQKADRTVLDYIARPLTDQIRRAFREE